MMSVFSKPHPCPIWDGVDDNHLGAVMVWPQLCTYPRAGGYFVLEKTGAVLLKTHPLTYEQRVNLSYWICHHNLDKRWYELSNLRDENLLVLDQAWVADNRDRTPSPSDRLLAYLRELILCADAGQSPNKDLLMATGGCRNDNDLWELHRHAVDRGWIAAPDPSSSGTSPYGIDTSARIYVEEQLRERGRSRQGSGPFRPSSPEQ